ncbi:MAG: hypothetical protein IPL87_04315 [Candidatus Moraniibacteriota bacterium]|nr:MAG: hypothetical protein IPL87_04315 [Candidatus Moranbacteria bacterium]
MYALSSGSHSHRATCENRHERTRHRKVSPGSFFDPQSFFGARKIPTDDVEAFDLLPGRANALREDVVRLSNPDERERIVSLFPARLGENLLVKAVF